MSKNRNPYREGSDYFKALEFWGKQPGQICTRSKMVGFYKGEGKTEAAALASATVIFSPREKDSKRGDCRGNLSAKGEIYFSAPTKKVKGQEKSFRLRYRAVALARREYERPATKVTKREVKQVKVAAKSKTPAVAPVAPAVVTPVAAVTTNA